jgi:hypothetical protein
MFPGRAVPDYDSSFRNDRGHGEKYLCLLVLEAPRSACADIANKAREARIPPPAKPRLTEAAERVVKLFEAWGKKDEAARWRAKLAKPSGEANKPHPWGRENSWSRRD